MISPIINFSIKKLFGTKDISIDFNSPVKLLISDNGGGKTTILYILYLFLARKFDLLKELNFEEITVKLSNGSTIKIGKDELFVYSGINGLPTIIREIKDNLNLEAFESLITLAQKLSFSDLSKEEQLLTAAKTLKVPRKMLAEHLHMFATDIIKPQISIENRILESFKDEVLYFPTFRRIERAFPIDKSLTSDLINFGMDDIIKDINTITSRIKRQSMNWFSDIDEGVLDDVYALISQKENKKEEVSNPNKIRLEPLSEKLPAKRKSQILEILKLKDKPEALSSDLAYLFTNLFQVREEQQKDERNLKSIEKICNKYLIDKQLEYDDADVEFRVIHEKTNEIISLNDLSFGEKQIVSLFSKIYLSSSQNLAIIFDEPELSISVEWQKMLLPDILNTNRCNFLFVATHSPFIFDNELDQNAVTLNRYVKELS